ncbi:MAG: hypothetical protein HWN51_03015, partial [Desulfobacterales bacterium]|nr:hypothetical protein [Desulfobacterales bacterium]
MTYKDNKALQKALLSVSRPGTLILTSGGRLARLLKHRYRQIRITAGRRGWASPDILSLNVWIRKVWDLSWPSICPLSHLSCLALWKEAASRVPPPEPFAADLALFEALDETYAVLVRHGFPPQGEPGPGLPLVEWRRQVTGVFDELAGDCKGFHPALLPARLTKAISRGVVELPDTIVLAAFEAPAPIENALFECLAISSNVKYFHLPVGTPERIVGVVLPTRKQEAAWLIRQMVMDARHIPLSRIGVVIPDTETYLPHVKQALTEILPGFLDYNRSSYNISAGSHLLERSLVQAGLLPLRFWVEGEPRSLLLSMVLSPYYGRWATKRDHIALADRLWRREGTHAGFKALIEALSHPPAPATSPPQVCPQPSHLRGFGWRGHKRAGQSYELFDLFGRTEEPTLEAILGDFGDKPVRTGAGWVDTLEAFWAAAGFPVVSDEADSGAWGHLRTILQGVR